MGHTVHLPQELKTVMNRLVLLHKRPVPTWGRLESCIAGLGCLYKDEWLAKMVACWSHLAKHRDQQDAIFGGQWLKTVRMVKVTIKRQNLGSKDLFSRNALVTENFHFFFPRFCFYQTTNFGSWREGSGGDWGELEPLTGQDRWVANLDQASWPSACWPSSGPVPS